MTVDELRAKLAEPSIPGDAVVMGAYAQEATIVVYTPFPESSWEIKPGTVKIH